MSELRKECYKCLNNSNCIGEYRSIYCSLNRRYNFKNIKYGKEKDKITVDFFVNMLEIKNKINKLEKAYEKVLEDFREFKRAVLEGK